MNVQTSGVFGSDTLIHHPPSNYPFSDFIHFSELFKYSEEYQLNILRFNIAKIRTSRTRFGP